MGVVDCRRSETASTSLEQASKCCQDGRTSRARPSLHARRRTARRVPAPASSRSGTAGRSHDRQPSGRAASFRTGPEKGPTAGLPAPDHQRHHHPRHFADRALRGIRLRFEVGLVHDRAEIRRTQQRADQQHCRTARRSEFAEPSAKNHFEMHPDVPECRSRSGRQAQMRPSSTACAWPGRTSG